MAWRLMAAAIAAPLVASLGVAANGDAHRITGGISTHVVVAGETVRSIGARAGIDAQVLARDNRVAVDTRLVTGQVLRLDNRHVVPDGVEERLLVINVPQRMLFFEEGSGLIDAFPIAVGRSSWRTPTGPFTVLVKETHPTWDVPESIRDEARRSGRELPKAIPPGPDNPLGAHWLGLSIPNVGVHGTNAPQSIYRAATHGCIRLHPDDIARLFARVQTGTAGHIVYEPLLLAVDGEGVFLEVHGDIYRRLTMTPRDLVRVLARSRGIAERIDWGLADAVIEARDGIAREVSKQRAHSETSASAGVTHDGFLHPHRLPGRFF